jgi:hypothetical protein
MDHDADVLERERIGQGSTERADIAAILDAIGGAANATLIDLSEAEDAVGHQMRRDLARLGSLIIYASLIREPAAVHDQNLASIVRFGRALRLRLDRI